MTDVPPNPSVPIVVDGGPQTANLTVPGQNATFPFDGTTGQRISLELSGVTVSAAKVSIVNPDGSKLLSPTAVGTAGAFFGPMTLPANGSYRVVFNATSDAIGDVTVELFNVDADVTGELTAGVAHPITISDPAQNAKLTFAGLNGQRVSLELTDVTIGTSGCCSTKVVIRKPDGTTLVPSFTVGTTGGFVDTKKLPADGTYKVIVNPVDEATGDMTLTLHDVPADDTGDLVFGEAHTFSISTPGQNSVHTFTGTGGQRVSFHVPSSASPFYR